MPLELTDEQRVRLHIVRADISTLKTDAVVNAANADFSPAGSVDQAIHEKAGTALRTACRQFVGEYGRCFAGGAEITPAFRLPARYVIHAVGPVWCGGGEGEAALLARAYARCMETARIRGLQSIAFSCVSTGLYGYPKREAATVALVVVNECLAGGSTLKDIVFCVYDDENQAAYEELIGKKTEDAGRWQASV